MSEESPELIMLLVIFVAGLAAGILISPLFWGV